jgi:hypothetical protein
MRLKLIKDYIENTKKFIYPDFILEDIEVIGGTVQYIERSGCGSYHESCSICMLDLMAWVYSKQ